MRLTALWLCGTLLALTSLSWTATNSGVGDILGDTRFGPCIATLRREETCRQGQDENSCPYLFSLPPLTVHLPQQLRELEEIVKDLQTLKDNVDQLRKMCSDCTVSQSERACGRRGGKEHEKLNEDTDRHDDGNKWTDERDAGKLNDCGIDRVNVERTTEGDGGNDAESRITRNEQKQWDSEKQGETRDIKESEKENPIKDVAEKVGKNLTVGAKATDKLGPAKVPTSGGKERTGDMARKTFSENSKRDGDKDKKETNEKSVSTGEPEDTLDTRQGIKTTINMKNTDKIPGSNHDVRQGESEKVPKYLKKEDRASDGIKMSEKHDAHTNEEQTQRRGENKSETGIKATQNNGKPKQTENVGSTKEEKTVKEGGAEEVDRELKTEGEQTGQTQRDSDGDSASSKGTDFVSISPSPRSAIGSDASYDSLDSNEAVTFTSSLPSPHLPSSASHSITDANQQTITAGSEPPTQSSGAAGVYEKPKRPTTTDAVNTLDVPRRETTHDSMRLIPTTGMRPGDTTTTSRHKLYTTAIPAVTGRGRWIAINKTRTGFKPLPGPKLDKKPKPGVRPKADQGQKDTKAYQKPDRAPLPNRKPEQKQKPSPQKPTTNLKPKPGKDTTMINISKSDQRASLDSSTIDQNLTNNLVPKLGPFSKRFSNQTPDSHLKSVHPVHKPMPLPVSVELATPDKQQPKYDENSFINPSSKPGNKQHHPPETNKPDRKQTPGSKTTNEEKRKTDHRSDPNQKLTQVGESESERGETIHLTTKAEPSQNEKPSSVSKSNPDSIPGQKLRPEHTTSPDQTPKTSQKIPKINQQPKPGHMPTLNQNHPGLVTNHKPRPNVKPNPSKTTQPTQGIKTPASDLRPDLNPQTLPDQTPDAESSKAVKPRPPPRHRPPATPVLRPGATRLQRPKPAVQPKPSPETEGDLDLLPSGVTNSNINHDSHADDVTHSSENPELSHSVMSATTEAPQSYTTMDTGAFTHSPSAAKNFSMSPNRRIPSKARPQAAGRPSAVPETTSPNNVTSGTDPASTKPLSSNSDSSFQPMILHREEVETAVKQSPGPDKVVLAFSSPSSQATFTTSPDITPAASGEPGPKLPDAESSTPSARELRVKINQVAALLDSSLGQNERPLDRGPRKPLEDKQGGRRPQQTPTSPQAPPSMRDCSDYLLQGETKSGVYLVTPDPRGETFSVLCDMEQGGGGWTLIQRRQDGSVNFNRTWAEYRSGFGDLGGGEFWLGNNMIHLLTRDRDMVLRVELQDFNGLRRFAQYKQFVVAGERMRFRLTVGGYSGTAGDALRFSRTYDHNLRAFTTPDRDHDRYPSGNCGAYYSSGWWFDACMAANLNGKYYVKRYKGIRDGIFWGTWHNISAEYYPTNYRQSFKSVRMMIRPRSFEP